MDIAHHAAVRRGVTLEILTVAWMLAEAAIAIGAGIAARSVLLTAFGADSVIELLSGIVLFKRLSAEANGTQNEELERVERTTTQVSAALLVLLCLYVVATVVAGLWFRIEPSGSALGLAVTIAALIAMPLLARAKRKVNRVLDSASLRADIAETVSCAYLAAVTLIGLGASMWLGWWWTQYVAAAVLLVWLIPEAREAIVSARDNGPIHTGDKG